MAFSCPEDAFGTRTVLPLWRVCTYYPRPAELSGTEPGRSETAPRAPPTSGPWEAASLQQLASSDWPPGLARFARRSLAPPAVRRLRSCRAGAGSGPLLDALPGQSQGACGFLCETCY